MVPVKGYEGRRVAVLGLGRSGLATAHALEAGSAEALCWDDGQEARAAAEKMGLTLHDLSKSNAFEDVSALIVSPGIAHLYPKPNPHILRALESGVPVDNDIGLFFKSFADETWGDFNTLPQIVTVTGSNGKSTTSALIHHILTYVNRPAQLAGNIGVGVFDIDPAHDGEVIVLELSSYQTELARALTPDIAVFTNLSPDHLDRHGGMGGYFAAKRRLFAEGGPDRAVIGIDEIEGLFLAGQLSEGARDDRVISVSVEKKLTGPGWQVFARKGFLSEYRKTRQVASIDLRAIKGLAGQHNHQNACAAYSACRALGIAPRQIEAAMLEFAGLPHRSQFLGVVNDISFVNDSKATNTDSARAAISAYENIRWIVGGLGKDGGLDTLNPDSLKRVKKAYIIGHSADEFALQLADIPHEICHDMDRAFARAVDDADTGDTVLLAPAAASFDQYPNFEKRGDAFVSLFDGFRKKQNL